ncbi:MAG TPA: LppX_LprAFG lipoprotein [Dehalococcoidia bacterium]|nr:LppX_LprAFG lipoprotein [Dehalococcoidia bacterium]
MDCRPVLRRLGLAGVIAAAVAATALAAACGGDGGDASGVSAQEVLSRAAQRFASVKTFHFRLEHENGATQIVFGLGIDTAEGDFVLPDRMSAEARGKLGPATVSVRLVAIGDRTWVTNPFSRQFERAPGSVLDIIDPAALVAAVARSLRDAKVEGSDSVDGVRAYRVKGSMRTDDLAEGLSFGEPGRTVEVEVWVGRDDSLIRRARLKGPMAAGEADNIVRQLSLSRYDAPVTIEEPR